MSFANTSGESDDASPPSEMQQQCKEHLLLRLLETYTFLSRRAACSSGEMRACGAEAGLCRTCLLCQET